MLSEAVALLSEASADSRDVVWSRVFETFSFFGVETRAGAISAGDEEDVSGVAGGFVAAAVESSVGAVEADSVGVDAVFGAGFEACKGFIAGGTFAADDGAVGFCALDVNLARADGFRRTYIAPAAAIARMQTAARR